MRASRSLPTVDPGAALDATWTRSLFEDTPAARRRLILSLYGTVGPGFCGSLLLLGDAGGDLRAVAAVAALVLAGALWTYLRRDPVTRDWIFPVAVVPTVCVGIAYATSGSTGDAYLALVGAPLACAAALFELPVVLSALAAAIATVVLALSAQMSAGAAAVSTLLLAPAAVVTAWVILSSASELRAARRDLQLLGRRDRALLRSLPDVLARVDREGRILDAQVPPRQEVQVSREDLVGRAVQDVVPRSEGRAMREAIAGAFTTDEPRRIEYEVPGPRRGRVYEARFVRSGPDEVTVIRRDVTDLRRAEEERHFSEALLGRMQEAVIVVDVNLEVVKWTGGAEHIYGWTAADAIGKPITSLVQPDLPGSDAAAFAASLAWKGTDHAVVRQRRKDGTEIVVDSNVAALHDATGKVKGYLAVCRDVTMQRQAEQALRESERWLRMSQEIARIGHYVYDVRADRWESSPALDAIFGVDASYPRKAADWIWLVHPEDRDAMRAYLAELLASGTRFDREYRIVNQATGVACWVHGLGEMVRDQDGSPVRLVGTIQDVQVRKETEGERNALQAKLARSARLAAMGTLVAGVAHEINNPLAAEIASQELAIEAAREARRRLEAGTEFDPAAEGRLLTEVIETLEDAQQAGQRIARIVKDFAAFGRPNPPRSRTRLADVVEQARAWLPASILEAATVRMEKAKAPDVLVATSQIEQVVINLVANAARAVGVGRKGTIVLRVGTTPEGAAHLDVVDDGVGIPREHLDRIFEPFFTTRSPGDHRGIGIGLAISHSIVEAHGGTLTVESEPGKGSTFRMVLPPAPGEA